MRDLFETELGMDKVSTQNTAPRDLLADEPLPTYQSQIEHSKADNSGRTEDEQQLIDALFTPEELEEIEREYEDSFEDFHKVNEFLKNHG